MDRAHRLGQRRTVNVYRLLLRGSVEEHIMGLQRFKLDVAGAIVNADNATMAAMDTARLLDLFAPGQVCSWALVSFSCVFADTVVADTKTAPRFCFDRSILLLVIICNTSVRLRARNLAEVPPRLSSRTVCSLCLTCEHHASAGGRGGSAWRHR